MKKVLLKVFLPTLLLFAFLSLTSKVIFAAEIIRSFDVNIIAKKDGVMKVDAVEEVVGS
ncbi:hypothetical protein HYS91_04225 [Candidatus Daviesbacteria bacterium]|nr:hypothetical protein [Candidatus Daviesbacteria bacterium]